MPAGKTKITITIILLSLSLGACTWDAPLELIEARDQAITGGQAYTGHPAVGRLLIAGGGLCTATLIGKRTVLTAAHCIKGSSFTFVLDNGERITSTSATTHPSYAREGGPNDIAVVRLASAPSVKPVAIATEGPTTGMTIVLIGFGSTYCKQGSYGVSCNPDSGQKRRATNTIAQLRATEFTFNGTGSTCKGDSGGPAFATIGGKEVQIGVTSRGQMPCGKSAIDTRVDAFADWISQTAGGDISSGQDKEAPKVTITAPAQDGNVDEGPVVVQATITDDSGKIARADILIDGQLAGKRSSAPYDFNVTLTAGAHQIEIVATDAAGNQGKGTTRVTAAPKTVSPPPTQTPPNDPTSPGTAPPKAGEFGANCGGPSDCRSRLCAKDPSMGRSYCTASCIPSANQCGSRAQCMPAGGQAHVCALDPSPGAPNPNGPQGESLIGSCSFGQSGDASAGWPLALILLTLALIRRRR